MLDSETLPTNEKLPPIAAFVGIVCSALFFQLIHELFAFFVGPPDHIQVSESPHDSPYWKWKNLCISWFHALACSTWIFYNSVMHPEHWSSLVGHVEHSTYYMVCFSIGYFLYDLIDMWRNNLLGKLWELTTHHIAIMFMMCWNLVCCQCLGWNIIALSAEINSFFLHTRKLLQLYHVSPSAVVYRVNMALNFLSFIVFRFGSSLWIIIGMLNPAEASQVSTPYWYGLFACEFVMNGINPILFWRLFKSDILKPAHKRTKYMPNGSTNGHVNGVVSKSDKNQNDIGQTVESISNGHHHPKSL